MAIDREKSAVSESYFRIQDEFQKSKKLVWRGHRKAYLCKISAKSVQ